MKHLSCVPIILCPSVVAKAAHEGAAAQPQHGLQGVWQAVSWEIGEKSLPADEIKKMKLTIKDNKMSHPSAGGKIEEATFVLILSATPKAIDMMSSTDPDLKGKTLQGIYSIDGDTLKLCVAEPGTDRPKEFKAGKAAVLLILRREKP